MGAESSTPIVHDLEKQEKPQNEAFEVVKIPRAESNASSNGTKTTPIPMSPPLKPRQEQRWAQRVSQPSMMVQSGSSSSLESEESLSSCQSPVPRSPDTSLSSTTKAALIDGELPSLQYSVGGRETPPPPPPGPPPQQQEQQDESFLPDILPACGMMPLSEMTETVATYLDPSNFTCDAFVPPDPRSLLMDPSSLTPMLNWWETDEADEQTQSSCHSSKVITQYDMLLHEAESLELGGDLPAALDCYNECLELPNNTLEQMAEVQHKIGILHWKSGSYEESLEVLQLCMSMYQDAFGFSGEDGGSWIVDNASQKAQTLSEVLNSLGRVHLSLGHLPQASRDLKQGLALVKIAHDLQTNKEENLASSLARTKYGLGMVQDAKGRPLKAKKYYEEALEIYRSLDQQVDIASCLNSMGALFEQSLEYDAAMDCYTEALMIYRSQLEQQHCSPVDVAVTLNNIGFMHHLFGEFSCAMKAYQDAVGIMESVLGPNHRNVASTRHNIGLVHAERGSYQEALQIFKDVLKTQRQVLGEQHTDIAITLDSVSNAYDHLGRTDRAIKYLERSLKIRQRALGKSHLLVAVTLDRLGKVLSKNGDLYESEERFQESLQVYRANNVNDGRIRHVKEYLTALKNQQAQEIEQTIEMNGQSYTR